MSRVKHYRRSGVNSFCRFVSLPHGTSARHGGPEIIPVHVRQGLFNKALLPRFTSLVVANQAQLHLSSISLLMSFIMSLSSFIASAVWLARDCQRDVG